MHASASLAVRKFKSSVQSWQRSAARGGKDSSPCPPTPNIGNNNFKKTKAAGKHWRNPHESKFKRAEWSSGSQESTQAPRNNNFQIRSSWVTLGNIQDPPVFSSSLSFIISFIGVLRLNCHIRCSASDTNTRLRLKWRQLHQRCISNSFDAMMRNCPTVGPPSWVLAGQKGVEQTPASSFFPPQGQTAADAARIKQ